MFGVGFAIADTIARAAGVPRDSVGPRARGRHPRAERGRARRLDLPAGAGAGRPAPRSCSAARRRTPRCCRTCSPPTRSCLEIDATASSGPTARRPPRSRPNWPRDRRLATPARWRSSAARRSPRRRAQRLPPTGRPHPRPRAVGRRRGRVRVAALDRHRRPRHRQDRDDPADLRRGQGAARVDRARRPHRPRGAPDGGVDRDGRVDDPLRARLDSRRRARPRTRSTPTCWSSTRRRWPTSSCWSRCCGRSATSMHVVLVGDADQLAPVGAGKPFAELVATKVVPVAELTHIFRQAAGSMIVRGAHAVRRGEPPSFSRRREPPARPVPDRAHTTRSRRWTRSSRSSRSASPPTTAWTR